MQYAAAETGISNALVQKFLRRELKQLPYHLQIGTIIFDAVKQTKVKFAEVCLRDLKTGVGYLRCIVFYDELHHLLFKLVKKKNCRVQGSEHLQTA